MSRQSNASQWQFYRDQWLNRERAFLSDCEVVFPQIVYSVWRGKVEVRQLEQTDYLYDRKWDMALYPQNFNRPRNEEVDQAALLAHSSEPLVTDNIRGYYRSDGPPVTKYGAISLAQLRADPHLTEDKRIAEELARQQREQEDRNEQLLAQGWKRCSYCHNLIAPDAVVRREIYAQQYQDGRITKDYCSAQCGAHDQFAHEG